ncbi:MAG: hypothetical protein Q8R92_17210 [Deltaproteobacteria bacterium]|nr:hypothetical protein [Deltaproteobacteria bacterium]
MRNGNIVFYPGGGTAGYYRMSGYARGGSVLFAAHTKPGWLHRVAVKFVLGWNWVDDPQPGSGVKEPTINGRVMA